MATITITIPDNAVDRVNSAFQREYPGYSATIPDPAWQPMIADPNNPGQQIPNPTPQGQVPNPVTPTQYTRQKIRQWIISRVELHEGEAEAQAVRAAKRAELQNL